MLGHWRVLVLPFNFSLLLKRWCQISGNSFLPLPPRTEFQPHHRGLEGGWRRQEISTGKLYKICVILHFCMSWILSKHPVIYVRHGWRRVPLHLAPPLIAHLSVGAIDVLIPMQRPNTSCRATRVVPVPDVQLQH